MDLKFVLTTSNEPTVGAKCVAKHLSIAGRPDIKVGAGDTLPAYSERGGVCAIPGLIQQTLKPVCENVTLPFYSNGVEKMVEMVSHHALLKALVGVYIYMQAYKLLKLVVAELSL